jgi:secreted trypsin-like serine protease
VTGVRSCNRLRLCLLALAVVLSPLIVTSSAIGAGPSTSVINGKEAAVGTFPYLTWIEFNNGVEGFGCSGTVVSSNIVLTAAHCVFNEAGTVLRNPSNYAISTGSVNRFSPQRVVSSAIRIAVFPGYGPSSPLPRYGDAAIIQLASPIAAPPIKLGGTAYWGTGTGAFMVGWGLTVGSDEAAPAVLHYGTTTIQSPAFCQSKSAGFQAAYELCVIDAPNHVYSACHGDSGGPLIVGAPGTGEPIEIGIFSSFQGEECPPTLPQFYTRADLVSAWVNTKISELAPPPAPAPQPVAPPAPTVAALPGLGAKEAAIYSRAALSRGLGYRFNRQRRRLSVRCSALETSKQRCVVSWNAGNFLYFGTVTAFYVWSAGTVQPSERYTISRIPLRCSANCHPTVFRR